MANATHTKRKTKKGSNHTVGMFDLKVHLFAEEGHWYAQGLEVDYLAQGTSEADVKGRFERGLRATVEAHLQKFGTISKLLVIAPQEAWTEFFTAGLPNRKRYSFVSFHSLATKITASTVDHYETTGAAGTRESAPRIKRVAMAPPQKASLRYDKFRIQYSVSEAA